MKKLFLSIPILFLFTAIQSQNIQVHYDFGKDRQFITTTLEMFKPDSMGSTFFFTDFDFGADNNSMSLSYFEIARYITLPVLNNKLDATVQFNDGHLRAGDYAVPIGQVWLAGLSYPVNLDFMVVKIDLLYRHADYSSGTDWQFTAAWFKPCLNDRLVFAGFLDVWTENRSGEKKVVYQAEPLVWLNVWKRLFVGGELELSYNFLPEDDFGAIPTLGLQWYF